ncbi:amino acid ABC transporter permease [Dethiosulfatarculus sandiegensis]|uniref:Putative glutamine transport system permease protein GlnP n=1 Tax=Dethiosulfatarculus sandiegensis TaxID=1429043 RepID=A0A0D2G865_9BACT|nr:amino acid ABC transporter permease [Dethiosulfatarculus sandiegensis]KIX11142.1 polar amino acid ABC transporter permease [Dethiosulfatarculus sandiegensis]
MPFNKPKRSTAATAWEITKFILTTGVLVWLVVRGSKGLGYNWQWYRVPQYLYSLDAGGFVAGPLLEGLWVTLKITFFSFFLAFFFGLTTALFRLSDSWAARGLARFYLETIRNSPLLIQIFFMYFVIAPILDINAFTSAVVSLSLFEGAYTSEIIRAGIQAIPKGQWEACHSLGLSGFDTLRKVILPQAMRHMLPPLTGQAVSLIKDSALVSTIAIYDLTMQAQAVISETFLTFEIWFTVAGIYLLLTASLSFLVSRLEDRMIETA